MNQTKNDHLYSMMYRIRRFEETVLDNFQSGVFHGTTHTYLGQEANAVGILTHLKKDDIVVSNHRCHGHFIAYGGDLHSLFAELMGKSTGVCGGRGGSQHIHWKNFYSNGVLGGTAPVAAGMALAEKWKGTNSVTIIFIGDGAMGEGIVYETFNLASLWNAPIFFVIENNGIAQTTPTELVVAGDYASRLHSFNIPLDELDTSDVLEISAASSDCLSKIRHEQSPHALIIRTCRFAPHSKGDDTRSPAEIERLRKNRDPIKIHAPRLDDTSRDTIEKRVDSQVSDTFQRALMDPNAFDISE